MKKIIGIASAVLLLSAGGAYIYGVQQFDQNAQNLVATIENSKPVLSFDSIEVDKYRFQIRFKSPKIDIQSFHEIMAKMGMDKNAKVEFNPEPILLSTEDDFSVIYNPLTKTAHLAFLNHEATGQFTQGNLTKGWTVTSSGDASIKIVFEDHPNFKDLDVKKTLMSVRHISAHSPKQVIVDARTTQSLMSCDSSDVSLDIDIPVNDQDNAGFKMNFTVNNQIIEKEFYEFCMTIAENMFVGEMRQQMSLYAQMMPKHTSTKTDKMDFNIKMKMSDLNQMIDMNFDIKKGLPVVSGSLNDDHTSNLGKAKTDITFDLDPKKFTLKLDVDGKCEPGLRQYYASYLGNLMSGVLKEIEKDGESMPAIPLLDEKTLVDITPDFASLGNIQLSLNMDGNVYVSPNEGKFDFNAKNDHYTVNVKYNYDKKTGGKIEAELLNSDQLMVDLKAYIDRIFSHKEIKDAAWAGAQENLVQSLEMGQMTLLAMGKKEEKDGKPVLKIEHLLRPLAGPPAGIRSEQK